MAMAMAMAMAMDTDMKNNSLRVFIACGVFILCQSSTSSAQDAQAFVIKPRIALTETWSDNVSVSSGQAGNTKESGFITELAPGIRVDARTARLKAYFDYALVGQFYSTSSGNSRTQNSLNTFGTLEAVSNWLFLDFSGIIAQQAIFNRIIGIAGSCIFH